MLFRVPVKLSHFSFIWHLTRCYLVTSLLSVGWNSYSNHESLLFTSLQFVFQQDINSLRAGLHFSVFPTVSCKQQSFLTKFFQDVFVDLCYVFKFRFYFLFKLFWPCHIVPLSLSFLLFFCLFFSIK